VAVLDTERDHAYPERTVSGGAVPPAAAFARRDSRPTGAAADGRHGVGGGTGDRADRSGRGGLHRVGLLELEYLHAVAVTENRWLTALIDDLRSGRLTWSPADFADPR
jgi:hypothetical protein